MPIGSELVAALKQFSALEVEIVELGGRVDPDNAREFVRMRRDLVMNFAHVGKAMDEDPWLAANPDVLSRGRRFFAEFRTANSLNQANWPVVRAKDDAAAYAKAAAPVGEKSRAFWQWVESDLGFRR